MNFVFEHKEDAGNFTIGNQQNKTGWNRFCIAPFFNLIRCLSTLSPHYKDMSMMFDTNEKPEKFIISTGLHNDPKNWGGGKLSGYENYESLFDLLSNEYVEDIKNNKALLLLDNSLEGFHEDWIFDFIHHECERFDINPSKVIYVTGNLSVSKSYKNWLVRNPKTIEINTLEYPHFQTDVFLFTVHLPKDNNTPPPTFQEQLEYKTKNLNNIKLYSYLNLKPRLHRVHLYYLLYINNLLDKGLISMEDFGSNGMDFGGNTPNGNPCRETFPDNIIDEVQKTLPARIDGKSNRENGVEYVTRFHPKVTLDSWVQVVSETYFYDDYETLFISEKTFKVIASSQPFIIFGRKGSLNELKKLGYKTFDKWWDESYDEMDDCDRMKAIIKVITDIDKIENKLEWFSEMKEVLEHNKQLIEKNTIETPPSAFSKVIDLYNKL